MEHLQHSPFANPPMAARALVINCSTIREVAGSDLSHVAPTDSQGVSPTCRLFDVIHTLLPPVVIATFERICGRGITVEYILWDK